MFAVHAGRRAAEANVVELEFADGALDPGHLQTGLGVWKTDDPALTKRLQQSFAGEVRGRDLPVRMTAEAAVGSPLLLRVEARGLPPFHCATDVPLAAATKHPLTEDGLLPRTGK